MSRYDFANIITKKNDKQIGLCILKIHYEKKKHQNTEKCFCYCKKYYKMN